jgi:hypothetical protein
VAAVFFLAEDGLNSYDQGMALHRTRMTQQQRQFILADRCSFLLMAVSR